MIRLEGNIVDANILFSAQLKTFYFDVIVESSKVTLRLSAYCAYSILNRSEVSRECILHIS